MLNFSVPFGFTELPFRIAGWGERQVLSFLQSRLDAMNAMSDATIGGVAANPKEQSLNIKMVRLLDRSLEQSTRGSQAELYHSLLDQLISDEARIVGALSDGKGSPLVGVYEFRSRGQGTPVLENACLVGRTANVALPDMVPQYVGHLLLLGLVEAGPEDPLMKGDYEVLMAETMVLNALKNASRGPLVAKVEKKVLNLSALGQALWDEAMQGGVR